MPKSPYHQTLERIARDVGFQGIGVSPAQPADQPSRERLEAWLANGYNAGMGYMARNLDKRLNPALLVPNAKTIVSAIASYHPGSPSVSSTPPKISRYALSTDYHVVLKGMLHRMLGMLREAFGPMQGRAFVDSAPVMDRYWAARAGLGWIGKSGLLISPTLGSYLFIGHLIVDRALEPLQAQQPNLCGPCTRCMDACPTRAIVAPGVIDSRRCIAYLTVEHQGPLLPEQREQLNGWCFGCDACQEVCPWNASPSATPCGELRPLPRIASLTPSDIVALTPESFREQFAGTPIERAGFELFSGNARHVTPGA